MPMHDAPPCSASPWRFCVAPMMEVTDRHCRYFLRLLSTRARLYTEMITTGALLHGAPERFLRFDALEHPLALQLGGNDSEALARCAELGARFGYDEINLNCGCPSGRVQEGCFGVRLMLEPQRVAQCVRALRAASGVPVTVKCRIGVDDSEEYDFLRRFVDTVAAAGCAVFIVHARKAWLKGLSPKENREIPPLRHAWVYRLKADFPELSIVLNGGIRSLEECQQHVRHVDGVMLGREVYDNPYLLAQVDERLFGQTRARPTRADVLTRLRPYVERELAAGTRLGRIARHLLGLYRGQPGARTFRRLLSERAHVPDAGWEAVERALAAAEKAAAHA
jgi:tRNA-dihydrouridine synthase A